MDAIQVTRGRRIASTGHGREIRLAAQLPLAVVAEAVGVEASTVLAWERGGLPRPRLAERYAEVIDEIEQTIAAGSQ